MKDGTTAKRVIGYVSKAFNKAERKYSTIERELAAIRFNVKAFKAFLYGIPFVIKTDHAPLTYLARMHVEDSRLARTLNDLTGFDFRIEYVPGERNEVTDYLSRLPVNEFPNEGYDDVFLPVGITQGELCPGGGDSMFKSLHFVLRNVLCLSHPLPGSIDELRTLVMRKVCDKPERWNVYGKRDVKDLKRLAVPGTLVFQGVLLVVSEIFKVVIHVFFGLPLPLTYRGENVVRNAPRIALQCLGGVHYNPLVMNEDFDCNVRIPNAEHKVVLDDDLEEENESSDETGMVPDATVMNVQMRERCTHVLPDWTRCMILIGERLYCTTWDSGSQLSLVIQPVVDELDRLGMIRSRRPLRASLVGLGEGIVKCGEEVCVNVKIGKGLEFDHNFIVVGRADLGYCFIFGIDLMRLQGVSLDLARNRIGVNGMYEAGLVIGEGLGFNWAGNIQLCPDKNELLTMFNIRQMQEDSQELQQLKAVISHPLTTQQWPPEVIEYKRVATRLYFTDGLLMLGPATEEEDFTEVPLVSRHHLIGLLLILHFRWGHLGRKKLYELAKRQFFHPGLRQMTSEITSTCDQCQRMKIGCGVPKAPTLKVQVKEPFDLVAMDCVAYPRTSRGHIGLLLAVDHKSKFLYATPLRKKTGDSITNACTDIVFPMCVRRPVRCLTDNGPEFRSSSFQGMLRDLGIRHIRITSFVSQANGMVERTIKTVTELLRMCTEDMTRWDDFLPKVLWVYNSTVHSALGMSPQRYVLEWNDIHRPVKENLKRLPTDQLDFNEEPETDHQEGRNEESGWQQEFWRIGSKNFKPHKIGSSVLKRIPRIGRRLADKFNPIFEGPYRVSRIFAHGLSYLIEKEVKWELREF